jgi:oxalyl-CoA decarboxylase
VPIAAPVIGDIASCVSALRAGLKGMAKPGAEWTGAITERVAASKSKLAPKLAAPSPLMNYSNSLGAVRDVLAKFPDVTLVNEGANALDNTRMIVDQYQPRKRVDSGTWGIMGIGMGACVAAANVTGKPVVAIEGDSAFGFSGMEIETIARYKLPVTVIVMNNGGIYKGGEVNPGSDQPSCTVLGQVRYDLMMAALGGVGINATTPAELAKALEDSIKSGKPTLINAVIDPDAGVESGRIQGLNVVSKVGKK